MPIAGKCLRLTTTSRLYSQNGLMLSLTASRRLALAVIAGCSAPHPSASPQESPKAGSATASKQQPAASTGSAQKPHCSPDLTHCARLDQQRVVDHACNETLRVTITNTCAEEILCNYRTTEAVGSWFTTLAPRARESNYACDPAPGVVYIARCSSSSVLPEGYTDPPGCTLEP
jgi:hypothetical protein